MSRSWLWVLGLGLLVALAGCVEPATAPQAEQPPVAESQEPVPVPADPDVLHVPAETDPTGPVAVEQPVPPTKGPQPPAEPAEPVEAVEQPEPETPASPTEIAPAEPTTQPFVATAELRERAIAAALAGNFRESFEALSSATNAFSGDPQTLDAIDLLERYLARQDQSNAERTAEYDEAVQRVGMAMMLQRYVDDGVEQDLRDLLAEHIDDLSGAYESVSPPDAVQDADEPVAAALRDESLGGVDASIEVVEAMTGALAGRSGPYAEKALALAKVLAGQLRLYRQAWSDASFETPAKHEASIRRLRRLESDLVDAVGDVDVLASEAPWRPALIQASIASRCVPADKTMTDQQWYRDLVMDIEQRAQALMDEAEWLQALAAYSGLKMLDEDSDEYERMVKRTRKHVRVLGLYSLRETDEADEDELATTQPASIEDEELWREYVQGINERMVRVIISRVESFYVTSVDYRDLINGALGSIQVLVETPQVTGTFEGLSDDTKREAFATAIQEALDHVAIKQDPLDHLDLLLALKTVLDESEKTVELPVSVLGMEFTHGFLGELDEFSQPIWPNDVPRFNKAMKGRFVGVGIQVEKEIGEPLKVVMPIADTPAFRAGIKAGDLIMAVDGVLTEELPIDQIIDMIVGEKGTTVVLRVRRRGMLTPVDMPIVRDTIKIASVKGWRLKPDGQWDYMLDPASGIGYIRVTRFTEGTPSDVAAALKDLRAQNASALVLDLRLNPGGLLREASRTVNEFVEGGQIVMTRGRHVPKTEINANWRGRYTDAPLIVLIDEYSASASEIVSGALQDMGRATVVGQRSYGKGSVQQVLPISGPPDEALLKLTSAYYYVGPSEYLVHRTNGAKDWGVEPDIEVLMTPQQTKHWLEIRQQTDLLHEVDPDQLEADLAEQYEADIQLLTAVTLLKLKQLATEPVQAAR